MAALALAVDLECTSPEQLPSTLLKIAVLLFEPRYLPRNFSLTFRMFCKRLSTKRNQNTFSLCAVNKKPKRYWTLAVFGNFECRNRKFS